MMKLKKSRQCVDDSKEGELKIYSEVVIESPITSDPIGPSSEPCLKDYAPELYNLSKEDSTNLLRVIVTELEDHSINNQLVIYRKKDVCVKIYVGVDNDKLFIPGTKYDGQSYIVNSFNGWVNNFTKHFDTKADLCIYLNLPVIVNTK